MCTIFRFTLCLLLLQTPIYILLHYSIDMKRPALNHFLVQDQPFCFVFSVLIYLLATRSQIRYTFVLYLSYADTSFRIIRYPLSIKFFLCFLNHSSPLFRSLQISPTVKVLVFSVPMHAAKYAQIALTSVVSFRSLITLLGTFPYR